ncbi:Dioxygenase [Rubrobacter radiotolerans]|uniref:Dioxygenase n=1 Tax=Rubrobacter radiotolerans TaxID=42256 RepID=A0A023X3D7_RUBRA|nr:dioxygenase [Rubrobacter radiotolerans]AHY46992.1 Dioxygenase [Rubrobacter radiotolerans]MDX5894398.1 dioxygenase [Rubrobacter radiotolerans]SMC05910.1 catechol 1,2-dioxygenase [Rubrobacter radiotolerans DSM 5868]
MADVAREVRNERLARILPEAIGALHELIEKHRVTEEEWLAVLGFLTEVGRKDEFVLLSDVTKTSVLVDSITHDDESGVTPSDVEGPLYRENPPWREKPVKIYEEYEGIESGDVLFVRGRVASTDGTPLSSAVLDVWQTGPTGGYDVWDEKQPDYNFRGRFGVEEDGGYEFQTMVPKPYTVPTDGPVGRLLEATGQHPWRPAHIHVVAEAEGHETLTTQVFFPDDPYLENDTIGAVKPELVRPLERCEDEAEISRRGLDAPFYTCEFDITLKPATPASEKKG